MSTSFKRAPCSLLFSTAGLCFSGFFLNALLPKSAQKHFSTLFTFASVDNLPHLYRTADCPANTTILICFRVFHKIFQSPFSILHLDEKESGPNFPYSYCTVTRSLLTQPAFSSVVPETCHSTRYQSCMIPSEPYPLLVSP